MKGGREIIDITAEDGRLLTTAKALMGLLKYKIEQVGKGPAEYELQFVRNELEDVIVRLQHVQDYERMPEYVFAIHDDGKIHKLTKKELYLLSGETMTVQDFLGGKK